MPGNGPSMQCTRGKEAFSTTGCKEPRRCLSSSTKIDRSSVGQPTEETSNASGDEKDHITSSGGGSLRIRRRDVRHELEEALVATIHRLLPCRVRDDRRAPASPTNGIGRTFLEPGRDTSHECRTDRGAGDGARRRDWNPSAIGKRLDPLCDGRSSSSRNDRARPTATQFHVMTDHEPGRFECGPPY